MPQRYFPSSFAHLQLYDSAFRHGVSEGAIRDLLTQPAYRLSIRFGRYHPQWDGRYGGRSTIIRGRLSNGHLIEVGLRRDWREANYERCIIFHARLI